MLWWCLCLMLFALLFGLVLNIGTEWFISYGLWWWYWYVFDIISLHQGYRSWRLEVLMVLMYGIEWIKLLAMDFSRRLEVFGDRWLIHHDWVCVAQLQCTQCRSLPLEDGQSETVVENRGVETLVGFFKPVWSLWWWNLFGLDDQMADWVAAVLLSMFVAGTVITMLLLFALSVICCFRFNMFVAV